MAISKTITLVPKVLRPINIILVNNMLYQITNLSHLNKITALNASIEFGILNDYNMFNTTSDPIYHIDEKAIQKRENIFVDIKNNKEYQITQINNKIELLNKKVIDKLTREKSDLKALQNKIKQEAVKIQSVVSESVAAFAKDSQTVKSQLAVLETVQQAKTPIKENMVDVGSLIELNIDGPLLLKKIDTSTFLGNVISEAK